MSRPLLSFVLIVTFLSLPGTALRTPALAAHEHPVPLAATPLLQLRFYLEAGLFETSIETDYGGEQDFLAASRHMHDVLHAKGYEVYYREFSDGHNPMNWTLADGLLALLGTNKR